MVYIPLTSFAMCFDELIVSWDSQNNIRLTTKTKKDYIEEAIEYYDFMLQMEKYKLDVSDTTNMGCKTVLKQQTQIDHRKRNKGLLFITKAN